MAEVNGISKHEESVAVSHLGKRKRTVSPEVETPDEPIRSPVLQDVLQLLRKYDTTPSLLKYPLPPSQSDVPDLKRARLIKSESASNTIEDRVLMGTYKSLHALRDDVKNVHDAILVEASAVTQNGTTGSDVRVQLSKLLDVLDKCGPELCEDSNAHSDTTAKANPVKQKSKQFLSLRSTVNGSAHVLFSGLQLQWRSEKVDSDTTTDAIGSGLPNGFELTDFSALGDKEDPKKQEKRIFEKVFTTPRRLKPLDLPHTAKDVVRGNTLDFIPDSNRADNQPLNKHDYKFAKLPTGSWLSYGLPQQDRNRVQQSSGNTDFKAALAANNVRHGKDLTEQEMFSSVYSSFAPSSDSAYSLVSVEDMSRQWWSQSGEQKLSRLFRSTDSEQVLVVGETKGGDEFADVVANFEPQEPEDARPDNSVEKEVDSLLEEISEMIETLSSYQRNRCLDHLVAGKLGMPEKPEFDTFEMLRNQLSILIASLPPFAVAKLNGDQLDELNISTTLVVEVPDYPGTGHPDDYILRRQKMAQQATQAAARPIATPQPVRPSYSSVQANTMNYNSVARNYTSSVPATAAYGMRTTQPYQTPTVTRPTYSQTPTFQTSAANQGYSANRPTIQQFQRPAMANGYATYASNTPLQPSTRSPQPQTPGSYA